MFQGVFLTKSNSILIKNNVVDDEDDNIDGFLWRDTCDSSTQLDRPILNKESFSSPG
jgi:hypothetical protein